MPMLCKATWGHTQQLHPYSNGLPQYNMCTSAAVHGTKRTLSVTTTSCNLSNKSCALHVSMISIHMSLSILPVCRHCRSDPAASKYQALICVKPDMTHPYTCCIKSSILSPLHIHIICPISLCACGVSQVCDLASFEG